MHADRNFSVDGSDFLFLFRSLIFGFEYQAMAFRPATKIKNRIAWGLQLNSSKKDKEKTAASMDRIKRRYPIALLRQVPCVPDRFLL